MAKTVLVVGFKHDKYEILELIRDEEKPKQFTKMRYRCNDCGSELVRLRKMSSFGCPTCMANAHVDQTEERFSKIIGCIVISFTAMTCVCRCDCGNEFRRPTEQVKDKIRVNTPVTCKKCVRKRIDKRSIGLLFPMSKFDDH